MRHGGRTRAGRPPAGTAGGGFPRGGNRVGGEWRTNGSASGSILVVTVLVVCALSVLLLTAADTVLLAHRVQLAFEDSLRAFYVAEAGLAHARALCPAMGAGGIDPGEDRASPLPWARWVPFGDGAYRLTARFLGEGPARSPLSQKKTGLLVEVCGRTGPGHETRIKMLLEDPPSCRVIAWWQPRGE